MVIAPSRPNKLSVQWVVPGEIVQQLSETNYVVKFPEKDKTNVYHVNMIKPYHQREENINLLCIHPLKRDEEEYMPTPGRETRPCIDYRRLNKEARTQFFSLPNIEELIERESAATCVSILDLTRGYLQIPLSPRAQSGSGIQTASRVESSNHERVSNTYHEDPSPILLDLADYYRRYIPEFSLMASPLTDLLKRKNRKTIVDWKEDYQKALGELKGKLTEDPVLYSPDFAKPFIIQCDASNLGVWLCFLK
ncbi:retrovirus-related Pol polyprotein from transposon 17.6 [Trichonephila inaurata madagascariensis]|uniref:Retrovirus-related Pol polyprotein from transposon 17.6 n=1 Tax=Trichonephila inaurata madagascariensis TaxID=2747483 RepID=A0A8X6M736_9ARAC|nr:retrovirus-related Pol polyprotein from transposon 17.6 [Trichonephila inaurata madagascariensis]